MPHRNCLQNNDDAENLLSKLNESDKKSKCILRKRKKFAEKEKSLFLKERNLPLKLVAHSSHHIRSIDLFLISMSDV